VNAPTRAFRPRLLPRSAEDVHARLTSDPETTVVAATAHALTSCAALLRRWGLVMSSLPTVTVGPPPAGELGAVEVRWRGRESDTGWPAMTGRLVVTPIGPGDSVLALYTTRPASAGLQVPAWTDLHRQRAADLIVEHFLGALVHQLERTAETGPALPRPTEVVR
jgi:hypothetical protein